MTIQYFPPTEAGHTAAHAVPDPKNIRFFNDQFEVRTGADYVAPPAPTQDEIDIKTVRIDQRVVNFFSLSPAQIETRINTVFAAFTAQQRNDLIVLALSVRALGTHFM
jgi:uncharacterized protein YciU (UPF0263 family)